MALRQLLGIHGPLDPNLCPECGPGSLHNAGAVSQVHRREVPLLFGQRKGVSFYREPLCLNMSSEIGEKITYDYGIFSK